MENDYVEIDLRYGGYWREVKGRRKIVYEGGLNKKIVVEVDRTSLKDFYDEILEQCPKLYALEYGLSYELPGCNPPAYAWVNSDMLYMKMLTSHHNTYKVKAFMDLKENEAMKFKEADPSVPFPTAQSNVSLSQDQCGGDIPVDPCSTPLKMTPDFVPETLPRRSPRLSECMSTPSGEGGSVMTRKKKTVSRSKRKLNVIDTQGKSATTSLLDVDVGDYMNDDLLDEALEVEVKYYDADVADDCRSQNSCRELQSSDENVDVDVDEDDDFMMDDANSQNPRSKRDPPMFVGRKFKDKLDFRNEIRQHAIVHNFEAKFQKNEGNRFVISCGAEKCEWRLFARALRQDQTTIEIRRLNSTHTCVGVNRVGNHQATSAWIAKQIRVKVKENRNLTPKAIADLLRNEFKLVNIPYGRIWFAREIAKQLVYRKVEQNYQYVPALVEELLRRNPGSQVEFSVENDGAFSRMFVSFGQCIEGFKKLCRPFLGLDGCHLRSKYMGILLAATALDGNNGLYPVAFAIVEGESLDAWTWFLVKLNEALGGKVEGLTIMSDMEKGLEEACLRVVPYVEHRVCMRHLWKSFKKTYPGDLFERLIWTVARSFSQVKKRKALDEVKQINVNAYNDLLNKGKDKDGRMKWVWSRSDFRNTSKNHYITNNISESFNAWVLEARSMPICDLVDDIRKKIMKKFELLKRLSSKWEGALTPMAEKYVVELSRNLPGYIITRANEFEYEVDDGLCRSIVNLANKHCTYNRWQLTGLPCSHATTIISSERNPDWSQYVDEYFHKKSYEGAYAKGIGTLPSKEQWTCKKECVVCPPNTKRPRGRPRKERIRGDEESRKGQLSKRVHKCTRCGGWGHHKNTCKNPITSQDQSTRPSTSKAPTTTKKKKGGSSGKRASAVRGTQRMQDDLPFQACVSQSTTAIDETVVGSSQELYVDPWTVEDIHISPVIRQVDTPGGGRGKKAPLRGKGAKRML